MPAAANRIEITAWRELFDDEDSMRIEVFAGDDKTTSQDVIVADCDTDDDDPLTFDYADPDSVAHPCTTTNDHELTDGQILTSHDGRSFKISITEVL